MTTSEPLYLEDLSEGLSYDYTRTVTREQIASFAQVSGDDNPLHLDETFASATQFGGCIAHGMLSAGFISAIIGGKFIAPGAIYLKQSLKFLAPVRPGDEVTARVTVREIAPEKRRVVLDTVCLVGGEPVIEGEALVIVARRP
jgi:3-hydroxybutyryl-CoA dehydratase